jgi:hypothetical protein
MPVAVASVREERGIGSVARSIAYRDTEITYEITGPVLPPPVDLLDFVALALVFPAMRSGEPLHIDGPVSAAMIRNLEEFQEAWAAWRPRSYAPVPITAREIRPASGDAGERTGIFAFSGGVDGTFALLRHPKQQAGLRTISPVAAMLIHGFDIPLAQTEAFRIARNAAAGMMEKLDLPLCVLRTNWKKVACGNWDTEFGAGMASCLHQFTGAATHGVLGADEDYAHLSLPWGSNPITNTFLSGGGFAIHTEGGGLTRTERLGFICKTPEVARRLRVCWEGPVTGGNCGVCEKCIRTKMNFLANGEPILCFDRAPTVGEILALRARNPVQVAYLEDIRQAAEANGISAPWVKALKATLRKNRAANRMRVALTRPRLLMKRGLRFYNRMAGGNSLSGRPSRHAPTL